MRFRVFYPHFERLGRPAALRVFNCASQESFKVFKRCLTSLMKIAFFHAKNDYFSDIYEVVPEANVPKIFVCFALAANGSAHRHTFRSQARYKVKPRSCDKPHTIAIPERFGSNSQVTLYRGFTYAFCFI